MSVNGVRSAIVAEVPAVLEANELIAAEAAGQTVKPSADGRLALE